jgi:hypothetical protein
VRWNFGPTPYETILKRVMNPFKYEFVMELFNFTFRDLMDLKRKIDDEWILLGNSGLVDFSLTDSELKKRKHASEIFNKTCQSIIDHRIVKIYDFLESIETIEKAQLLLDQLNIPVQQLKEIVWKIEDLKPYKKPLKSTIIPKNDSHQETLVKLKKLKISNNLALLDAGRTRQKREQLSTSSGISLNNLNKLIHRADFARGSHVSGRTVDHLFNSGLDTVKKIQTTDMQKIIQELRKFEENSGTVRKDKIILGFVIYAKITPGIYLD